MSKLEEDLKQQEEQNRAERLRVKQKQVEMHKFD